MSPLRLAAGAGLWLLGYAFARMVQAAKVVNDAAWSADIDASLAQFDDPEPELPVLPERDPASAVMCVDPDCTLCAPLRTPDDLRTEVADELSRRRAEKEWT
jgi:hypothetical protein